MNQKISCSTASYPITESPNGPVLGKLPSSHYKDGREQIRIITLKDGQHLDSTLYRLEKGKLSK